MTWFLRFILGLRARPRDITAMRLAVPELVRWEALAESERRRVETRLIVLVPYMREGPELASALAAWGRNVMDAEEALHVTRDARECPRDDCPLRSANGSGDVESQGDGTEEAPPEATDDEGDEVPRLDELALRLLVGGGPDRGPPLAAFLDLVRRVHADLGPVRTVVVTDPYLLTDRGEGGTDGGFGNFLEYLRALPLPENGRSFRLLVPPNPKKGARARHGWERSLKEEIPQVEVGAYKGRLVFHDRFYVAAHGRGQVRALFGPSMNGLGANDIVLMGEVDDTHATRAFRKWFEL